jgi:hypothetical protein
MYSSMIIPLDWKNRPSDRSLLAHMGATRAPSETEDSR